MKQIKEFLKDYVKGSCNIVEQFIKDYANKLIILDKLIDDEDLTDKILDELGLSTIQSLDMISAYETLIFLDELFEKLFNKEISHHSLQQSWC